MSSLAVAAEVPTPASGGSPRRSVLWTIALGGCAAGVASITFALTNDAIGDELGEPLVISALFTWTTLAYIFGGLLAWSQRPASRFGPLMVAAGVICFLVTLSWTSHDVSYSVGQALDKLPAVVFLHVFLAFPSGRLSSRFERVLVASAYVTAIGLELARMAIGDYGTHNLLGFAPLPGAFEVVRNVQLLLLSGMCLIGVGILFERRRRAGRPLRRSLSLLIDSFALCLVMIAVFFVANVLDLPEVVEVRRALFVTLGLAPVALVVGFLDARLARSAVGDLVVELRTDVSPAGLQDALARALRDPSLALVYWLPEFATWADLDGQPVELPERNSGRATTLIDRDGARMAALLHDPALKDEPELLAAVGAAAGIALENGRLHAEQQAHLEELRGSRARVIEAGQQERQRLERNLHDGAQQRLIALSLELSVLEKELKGDPAAGRRLDAAQREIAMSLEELRAVARGLHPAVLTGHGLAVALEQVAARAAVPVRLEVETEARFPETVEVAAYYVVTESLANIGKHARATRASVELGRNDSGLFVEVVDDGVGGADSERGTGLRGLADRVEALGGRLRVWTPQGGGTRVRAEIPCA
jgi:signal transduction histidine kinase